MLTMTRTIKSGVRRRASQNKTPARTPRNNQVARLSRSIQDLNLQTSTRMIPDLPDVNRMKISRRVLHTYSRSMVTTITSSTFSSPTGFLLTFDVSTLPAWVDFVNLYDEYRILQVQIDFHIPNAPPNGTITSIETAITTNDNITAPTSIDLLQFESYMYVSPTETHYFERTLVPAVLTRTVSLTGDAGHAVTKNKWMDISTSYTEPTPQLGLLYLFSGQDSGGDSITIPITVTYVFQCRIVS